MPTNFASLSLGIVENEINNLYNSHLEDIDYSALSKDEQNKHDEDVEKTNENINRENENAVLALYLLSEATNFAKLEVAPIIDRYFKSIKSKDIEIEE